MPDDIRGERDGEDNAGRDQCRAVVRKAQCLRHKKESGKKFDQPQRNQNGPEEVERNIDGFQVSFFSMPPPCSHYRKESVYLKETGTGRH